MSGERWGSSLLGNLSDLKAFFLCPVRNLFVTPLELSWVRPPVSYQLCLRLIMDVI